MQWRLKVIFGIFILTNPQKTRKHSCYDYNFSQKAIIFFVKLVKKYCFRKLLAFNVLIKKLLIVVK